MPVNSAFKLLSSSRMAMSLFVATLILVIFFVTSSFSRRSNHDDISKQINLVIRQMGHQLLLQAGDSTSRVLPVTEIKEGLFQLRFENEFVFSHDSLLQLSQNLLLKTQFPSGYTVTVHDCFGKDIIYGFQINNAPPDVLACQGRSELPGCYVIEIYFPDLYENPFDYLFTGLVCSSMLLLFGIGLLIGRLGKKVLPDQEKYQDNSVKEPLDQGLVSLGKFSFDVKEQRLLLRDEVISLTDKECKILDILNSNFGELISREELMEKVWINEGVITSRSLDMFVSKLRKKLSLDPQLRITNVHGKGYKLETHAL